MIFHETVLAGCWRIEAEPHRDERGSFARLFCEEEFAAHGLASRFEQTSLSRNDAAGTLRGMHFVPPPEGETKLVRCVRGTVFDVLIDLRPGSATRGRWVGAELSADNAAALYVPPGVAHGFLTLEPESDVLYAITPAHRAGGGSGVRWDDPAFAIGWPSAPRVIAKRDAAYPDWQG